MKRIAIACLVVLLAGVASADGEKILVLRAEGRADKNVRTRIEAAVLKLAQSGGQATTAGDVTFGDAAMMVGCKPDDETCKIEVVGMLAVDEIVTITATPKPGGIEVAVRRIGKAGATRNAATLVSPDKADQLDAIAPLFGAATRTPPPPRLPPPAGVTPTPTATRPVDPVMPRASTAPTPTPATSTIEPAPVEPIQAAPATTATAAPLAEPGPIDAPDDRSTTRRLSMYGLAGGGVLLIAGVIFWASAASIESDIADAPKETRAQLEHVRDLEDEGDGYATTGNVLVVGGLILGGVSTYYFWKSGKRAPARSARVVPLVGNGTGIAVTWGGTL